MTQTLQSTTGADGIATITMDLPDRTVNVLSDSLLAELDQAVAALASDPAVRGILLRSGKPGFVAGADLIDLLARCDRGIDLSEAHDVSAVGSRIFRRIETCGKPVAVAINGFALGGGLELCLACHYRVLVDEPRAVVGFPEVRLGLLPGGGGTQRLPRLIGQKDALPLLLEGNTLDPSQALRAGLVDEIAPRAELEARALRWLRSGPAAVQAWDRPGYRACGAAGLADPETAALMRGAIVRVATTTHGNYPAPPAILACVLEGAQLPMDRALALESKYFATLLAGDVARNMMRTLFVHKGRAKALLARQGGAPSEGIATLEGTACATYARRVLSAYADEGRRMLAEGIGAALIVNAARQAGMARIPLPVATATGAAQAGPAQANSHDDGDPPIGALVQRLLHVQALEAAHCLEQGVIGSAIDADVAAVFGWDFPAWTGGPLSLIDTLGVAHFVDGCDALAQRHGEHFTPSEGLRARARNDQRFHAPGTGPDAHA